MTFRARWVTLRARWVTLILQPHAHAHNGTLEEALEEVLRAEAPQLRSYAEGDEECMRSGYIKRQLHVLRFFLEPDMVA